MNNQVSAYYANIRNQAASQRFMLGQQRFNYIGQLFIKKIKIFQNFDRYFEEYIAKIVKKQQLSSFFLKIYIESPMRATTVDTTAFLTFAENVDHIRMIQLLDATAWGNDIGFKYLNVRANGFTNHAQNQCALNSIRYNAMQRLVNQFNDLYYPEDNLNVPLEQRLIFKNDVEDDGYESVMTFEPTSTKRGRPLPSFESFCNEPQPQRSRLEITTVTVYKPYKLIHFFKANQINFIKLTWLLMFIFSNQRSSIYKIRF